MAINLGMGTAPSSQMSNDWNSAWNNATPGQKFAFGNGGNVTFNGNGQATYTSAGGNQQNFGQSDSIDSVASRIPGMAQEWGNTYGYKAPSQNQNLIESNPSGGAYMAQAATPAPSNTFGQGAYLDEQAKALREQSNQNLAQNVMPGIGQGAQAAGGYGGSRQGIAQGVAAGNAQTGLNSAIAQMRTQAYGQDQNYALQNSQMQNQMAMANMSNQTALASLAQQGQLQNKSMDNSYNLGLRSSDLGFANLDANINNSNFSNQLAAANFGLNAYGAMNGQTATGIQAGTQIQNTPLDYQKYFTNSASGVGSGFGTSTSSQTNQGNPWLGAVAGAQMGNSLQYPTTPKVN